MHVSQILFGICVTRMDAHTHVFCNLLVLQHNLSAAVERSIISDLCQMKVLSESSSCR